MNRAIRKKGQLILLTICLTKSAMLTAGIDDSIPTTLLGAGVALGAGVLYLIPKLATGVQKNPQVAVLTTASILAGTLVAKKLVRKKSRLLII